MLEVETKRTSPQTEQLRRWLRRAEASFMNGLGEVADLVGYGRGIGVLTSTYDPPFGNAFTGRGFCDLATSALSEAIGLKFPKVLRQTYLLDVSPFNSGLRDNDTIGHVILLVNIPEGRGFGRYFIDATAGQLNPLRNRIIFARTNYLESIYGNNVKLSPAPHLSAFISEDPQSYISGLRINNGAYADILQAIRHLPKF